MPIVQHTIETQAQPDGRLSYTLRLYDQEGSERRTAVGLLPAGANVQAFVSAKILETDEQLAEDEFRALVGL